MRGGGRRGGTVLEGRALLNIERHTVGGATGEESARIIA